MSAGQGGKFRTSDGKTTKSLVKNLERLFFAVKGQRKALIYLPLTATMQAYFIQGRVKITFSPPSENLHLKARDFLPFPE